MLEEFEMKLHRLCKLFRIKYRTADEEVKYQGTIQEFSEESLEDYDAGITEGIFTHDKNKKLVECKFLTKNLWKEYFLEGN